MAFPHKTASILLALPALAVPAVNAVAATTGGATAPTTGAPTAGAPVVATAPPPARVRPSGVATWFGPGFYGRKTACGQRLTPAVVGVANRTLPCGTLVKVTYAGHSLTLPVLDRGPYSHIASWDLTAGAAIALGITETVRIRTRVVGATINSPTLGAPAAAAAPASAARAGGAAAG